MQISCGTDIIEISRIKAAIEDETGAAFVQRIFTQNEIEYCEGKKAQRYQHYAARFAGKEAIFKAISKFLNNKYDIEWKQLEILNDETGRPKVNIFHEVASQIESIDISLSHCKTFAIANVLAIFKDEICKKRGKTMQFFDSHSHLNDEKFDEDRYDLIEKFKSENIAKFLTCGYNLEGSKKATEIANNCDFTYATVGISPNDIPQNEEELWNSIDKIELLAQQKKVVAIGEIGLDFYWNKDNRDLQLQAFKKQIDIANKLNLPIVIHTREAVMDTIQVLKENNVINKGVFHCCPLNRELVKEALKLGFYISFSGVVTFKNAKNADEIISIVPLDKILIETDSPYLAPEPVRGTRNTPINVKLVAAKVAQVKNISIEEVAEITFQNACELFKISR